MRYSLWLRPDRTADPVLTKLVNDLAQEFGAPRFAPHITLVANIEAGPTEVSDVHARVDQLAATVPPIDVTLDGYGYTDEEFRCLFLKVVDTPELQALYAAAEQLFPQVAGEHFAALPHMSVLYGKYNTARKQAAIATHPVARTTFTARGLDLFLTEGVPQQWRTDSWYSLRG